jgi:hypothetical protein
MGKHGRFLLSLLAAGLRLAPPARAVDRTDILGGVGGGFVVAAIAGPLNDFINTVTLNHGGTVEEATKVVPIVSLGSGTKIGAAQVSGPKAAIDRTRAVAQLETTFQSRLGIKVLIPVDSENPLERFRRVRGVGVSAVIDLRL